VGGFRRVLGGVAVVAAAGLAVAGCAPVKMGAAAIVGSNSVSIAQLDTEAGMLAAGAKQYPTLVNLTQQQITQETLSWLIRFQIANQVATDNGITVTTAQAQQTLNNIIKGAIAQAESSGVANASQELILVANGIPPNQALELGRYQAIEDDYLASANGGTLPASGSTALTAAENQFTHATCQAAKALSIQVNPQFGRLSYASTPYTVVTTEDTVSRPSGTRPPKPPTGLIPAC
jgi:hypothetical protein